MGSKAQRQNKHQRRLMSKIRKFEKADKNITGLQKELSYCMGEAERPSFKTGRDADPRLKKLYSS
jgi:hypothetical protein